MPKNQRKSVELEQTQNLDITQLLHKIQQVATDQSFHTKTAQQLFREYGITITGKEKKLWSRYRNEKLREQAVIKQQLKKYEELKKRERKTFFLGNLTNEELCQRLIELAAANRSGNPRGRDSMNQLVRALNTHTIEELQRIVEQIKTFDTQQQEKAQQEIETIRSIYRIERQRQKGSYLLNQLDDDSLREEFVDLYESALARNWMPLVASILKFELEKLGSQREILAFQNRVINLKLSPQFTQAIKTHILECVAQYIQKLT